MRRDPKRTAPLGPERPQYFRLARTYQNYAFKYRKTQKNSKISISAHQTGPSNQSGDWAARQPTRRRFDRRVAARPAVSGDDFYTTSSSLPDLHNPGGGASVGSREMLAVEQKQPRRLPPATATLTGECGPPRPPMISILVPNSSSRRALRNPIIIFHF